MLEPDRFHKDNYTVKPISYALAMEIVTREHYLHRRAALPDTTLPESRRHQPMTMTTEVLTTVEAAQYVRLKKTTLERFRLTGKGPTYCKLGAAVRYRRCDLDEWLKTHLINSTNDQR